MKVIYRGGGEKREGEQWLLATSKKYIIIYTNALK